jgi:hypothetical protein
VSSVEVGWALEAAMAVRLGFNTCTAKLIFEFVGSAAVSVTHHSDPASGREHIDDFSKV